MDAFIDMYAPKIYSLGEGVCAQAHLFLHPVFANELNHLRVRLLGRRRIFVGLCAIPGQEV